MDAVQEMPEFAKYLKDLLTKKKKKPLKHDTVGITHRVSAIISKTAVQKRGDPEAFTIPGTIGRKDLIDSEKHEIKFRVNDEEMTFQASKGMKLPSLYQSISVINSFDVVDEAVEFKMEEDCLDEALSAILVNFNAKEMEGYIETTQRLLTVLRKHLRALGWTIVDIRGIPSGICEHRIQLEEKSSPSVGHQRRLNPPMQEVVKKTIIQWLDARVVYPIDNSPWKVEYCILQRPFMPFIDQMLDRLAERVLQRFEETNLVLNWEKCHLMVNEGIVLGHKISEKGIEVDQAKIDVISKLSPPISVKGVRSFLGHAGFYRRFIKDFSKIANPMCKLLEKESKFNFDETCIKAFE
ncbi:uncharacterized protein LOC132639242 [Lycium barbarum]|uniref:uncharacterized protein LOC132639242 n=1 Tax=Lycium barbarum TaxID=112863 RepID=UPI00293ED038|nr:uncharacterized protein LOC132639242 [Lycium barbarum]